MDPSGPMLEAQRQMITQQARHIRCLETMVRELCAVIDMGITDQVDTAAIRQSLIIPGPVPTQEQGREDTQPMDRDADRREVEEHKKSDHIKTLELPTLAKLGLGGAS